MEYQRQCIKCGELDRIQLKYNPKTEANTKTLENGVIIKTEPAEDEHLDCFCGVCGYTWKSLTYDNNVIEVNLMDGLQLINDNYTCKHCGNSAAMYEQRGVPIIICNHCKDTYKI
jgi:ribosomal protein L37AE/L43A